MWMRQIQVSGAAGENIFNGLLTLAFSHLFDSLHLSSSSWEETKGGESIQIAQITLRGTLLCSRANAQGTGHELQIQLFSGTGKGSSKRKERSYLWEKKTNIYIYIFIYLCQCPLLSLPVVTCCTDTSRQHDPMETPLSRGSAGHCSPVTKYPLGELGW